MCPTYQATHEERHSTRGRARLLWEMLEGEALPDLWRSDEVARPWTCASPARAARTTARSGGHRHVQGRVHGPPLRRPAAAARGLLDGLIHWWAHLAAIAPGLANAVGTVPGIAGLAKLVAGVDGIGQCRASPDRHVPPPAARGSGRSGRRPRRGSARRPVRRHVHRRLRAVAGACGAARAAGRRLLGRGAAGEPVLRPAALRPRLPEAGPPAARPGPRRLRAGARLGRAGRGPRAVVRGGLPRRAAEPVPGRSAGPAARRRWRWPGRVRQAHADRVRAALPGRLDAPAVLHGHCHQKATVGMAAEEATLRSIGLAPAQPEPGCCGMAGAFGFERGEHYELSMKIGERALLPAVRAAEPDGAPDRRRLQLPRADRPIRAAAPCHLAEVLLEMALTPSGHAPREASGSSSRRSLRPPASW
jgi:hypothetical protein